VIATRRVRLDAGAETTVTFDARVPDLETGSYLQGVYLAGTDEGEEGVLLLSAGPPRFAVSNLRGPPSAIVGDRVSMRATVTTTGRSIGSTEVQYRLDGQVIASESVDLDPGESRTLTLRGTVPGPLVGNVRIGSLRLRDGPGADDERRRRGPTPTATPTPTSSAGPGFTALLALVVLLAATAAALASRRG